MTARAAILPPASGARRLRARLAAWLAADPYRGGRRARPATSPAALLALLCALGAIVLLGLAAMAAGCSAAGPDPCPPGAHEACEWNLGLGFRACWCEPDAPPAKASPLSALAGPGGRSAERPCLVTDGSYACPRGFCQRATNALAWARLCGPWAGEDATAAWRGCDRALWGECLPPPWSAP